MVARVGHVHVACGIDRQAGREDEFARARADDAPGPERLAGRGVEPLQAVVRGVGDEQPAARIEDDSARPPQRVVTRTDVSKGGEQSTGRGQLLNPRARRVDDEDSPLIVHGNT